MWMYTGYRQDHLIKFFDRMPDFLRLSDEVATAGFSLFNAGGIIFMIVGIFFSKGLADRYGKRDVFGVGLFLSALCLLAFVFCPPEAVRIVFLTQMLHGFFYGLTIPLLWAMIFGLKAGLSIGGAMVAGILGGFGYDESLAIQSPQVMNGIKLLISIFPTLTFMVRIGCLFFYNIDKKMEVKIEKAHIKKYRIFIAEHPGIFLCHKGRERNDGTQIRPRRKILYGGCPQ